VRNPLQIDVKADGSSMIVSNNIQRKSTIETSNRQGLNNLKVLYSFLSPDPVEVVEKNEKFEIRIPLIES
jgi:two-component system LytT family sensor kinase